MTPTLSLVTGTLDRPKEFERLLGSIIRHTSVDWELVVADASSGPKYTDGLPGNVVVIEERPRLGHSKGYNRAFNAASGTWVIWLNDDAEVTPGYAENAIRFMEVHPRIGLGCLYYSENGGPFHVNNAWMALYANFGILKKQVGQDAGWFDEELYMYGADNSLAIRILIMGYGVAGIPDSRILHHSVNDQQRRDNQNHRGRDNRILTKKYLSYPLMQQWQATYKRHSLPHDHPWVHGVPPGPTLASRHR